MEFKTKKRTYSLFESLFVLAGMATFITGIYAKDWFMLVGGFLWTLQDIEIVHWNGAICSLASS